MEMQITRMADKTQESLWDLPPTDLWQRDRLGLCEWSLIRRLVKPHVSIGRSGEDDLQKLFDSI